MFIKIFNNNIHHHLSNLYKLKRNNIKQSYLYCCSFGAQNMAELPLSNSEAEALCAAPHSDAKDYIMQQTMYRIKDPKRSLKFYSEVLGMSLLQKFDFPSMKFSLYFMGFEDPKEIPKESEERTAWLFSRKATIELTHNWGTENDPNFQYHNGNSDPRGYGHIGVVVPDVYTACERFEKLGVDFQKKPDDGKMKGVAFIKDPDGYWIEILSLKTIQNVTSH